MRSALGAWVQSEKSEYRVSQSEIAMNTKMQRGPVLAMALGFIGIVIFGATLPITHIGLAGFSPWFLTFSRAVIAATAAMLFLVIGRHALPKSKIPEIFLAGLLVVFGFPGFATLAMQTVPASHGGVILGLLPLMTAVFAALFGGEKPGPLFWTFGILGAVLVVTYAMLQSAFSPKTGDFWLLAAGITVSLGYVLMGRLSRTMSGGTAISWALVLTLPISMVGTVWNWQAGIMQPDAASLWALAYLGLFSMFGGFLFWNAGLAMGGIARVGQVQLLQTFVTLAFSALLLGEHISTTTLAFAVAIGAVVWIGRKTRIS